MKSYVLYPHCESRSIYKCCRKNFANMGGYAYLQVVADADRDHDNDDKSSVRGSGDRSSSDSGDGEEGERQKVTPQKQRNTQEVSTKQWKITQVWQFSDCC